MVDWAAGSSVSSSKCFGGQREGAVKPNLSCVTDPYQQENSIWTIRVNLWLPGYLMLGGFIFVTALLLIGLIRQVDFNTKFFLQAAQLEINELKPQSMFLFHSKFYASTIISVLLVVVALLALPLFK